MSSLREIALLFLRLGASAFGGPAAHIAMMEEECVRKRAWLSHDEFVDLLGATNLIPGPNSTEMAMHIGHRREGVRGLLVAGACFIVPSASITIGLAWLYTRYGTLPRAQAMLYGMKPIIVAIVAQAIVALSRSAVKSTPLGALAVISGALALFGIDEIAILVGAGMIAMAARFETRDDNNNGVFVPLGSVFFSFLKIGAVLYGSGYVLLAFLRTDLVEKRHWITETQLLDAITAGQITPGPVFTTATFVGYLVRGLAGACVATIGIFSPAFIFVGASGPLIPKIRRSPRAAAFLDGVSIASLGLMAAVTLQLARSAVTDIPTIVLGVAGGIALVRFKVSSIGLLGAGAIAGTLIQWLR